MVRASESGGWRCRLPGRCGRGRRRGKDCESCIGIRGYGVNAFLRGGTGAEVTANDLPEGAVAEDSLVLGAHRIGTMDYHHFYQCY